MKKNYFLGLVIAIFFLSVVHYFQVSGQFNALAPEQGGTGTSTPPSAGYVLIGNPTGDGTYILIASSSLPGTGGTTTTINGVVGPTFTIQTSTASGTWTVSTSTGIVTLTIPSNVGFFTNDSGYLTAVGAVTSANSIKGAVNWLASGPGLSVASSGQNITYTFASSSLNLGTISVVNSPVPIANGGRATTSVPTTNRLIYFDGTAITSTSTLFIEASTTATSSWVLTSNGSAWVASSSAGGAGTLTGNGTSTYIARYNTTTGLISDSGFTRATGSGVADCTGGTISYAGSNTIHTFNTSSSLICATARNVSVLVVGGGGGGGNGASAGGGGGGVASSTSFSASSTMTVTVGSGGAGQITSVTDGTPGASGTTSTFATISASGGGGGGSYSEFTTNGEGQNGASGGGGGSAEPSNINSGGTATPSGQGHNGGTGFYGSGYAGGGGGGAGSAGGNASSATGGNGGNGVVSSISGSSVTYGGGGGGGSNGGTPGTGGTGGGGNGKGGTNEAGLNGTDGLGGGGGGGGVSGGDGGNGGRGVVIVSYPSGINTTQTDNLVILDTTSSTLTIGTPNKSGCLILGDSANGANPVYITATGSTLSATTTKPTACK